jgi:hypothetical protein
MQRGIASLLLAVLSARVPRVRPMAGRRPAIRPGGRSPATE